MRRLLGLVLAAIVIAGCATGSMFAPGKSERLSIGVISVRDIRSCLIVRQCRCVLRVEHMDGSMV